MQVRFGATRPGPTWGNEPYSGEGLAGPGPAPAVLGLRPPACEDGRAMRMPDAISYRRVVAALCLALLAGSCAGRKQPATSTDLQKHEERGIASYYGKKFHGRTTANGERFDMRELTAAHRTLPFGTVVRVTNLNNGLEVRVRINDRGPFVKGRIIDLSRGAAKKLDMIQDGIVPVRIKVVGRS